MEKVSFNDLRSLDLCIQYAKYDKDNCLPDVSKMPESIADATLNFTKALIILEALNMACNSGKKWIPDWDNRKEKKWEIWWLLSTPSGAIPGSGFVLYFVDFATSDSDVGARLVFKEQVAAIFAAEKFQEIFKSVFTFFK